MSNEPTDPSFIEQTVTFGQTLKDFADRDPSGVPTNTAAAVFAEWLVIAGPLSRQPGYFQDVADNYVVQDNSNRNLFDLFELLGTHIDIEEEDLEEEDLGPRTFIGLPMIGGSGDKSS
ncbi:hypothetical protein CCAX7_005050 [Capsulimonas corticalis]|uniref:Uncharacterized protein n=1 Tax=Capsulimonas corticalis TaxID=2219043 RepID=A0A402D2M8_9BACT|nr:hypothetical protein [Capsulimonas corticalis]BDI28454.1 hypothetical protein CCAX7_005050 [Capsulimonas corticalis]